MQKETKIQGILMCLFYLGHLCLDLVASACSAFMAGKVHLMFAFTVHVYKGCKDDIAVHSAVAQVAACHAASHPGQSLAARSSTGILATWPGGQVSGARWPGGQVLTAQVP